MFNDNEARSALTKIYKYSPVDGFIEISEELGEMIKSLANEPSVGLFYVQQHTHKAVPNLVSLRNNITSKSRDISLHTEDSEDSITMVQSMKECGLPIVDDMIKDITKSLAVMSSRQPKRGLISSRSFSGFQMGKSLSGGVDDEKGMNYLSSVFKSAKRKANRLKWAPVEASGTSASNVETVKEEKGAEVDELISSLSRAEKFDEFKADKEAKLEEWLGVGDKV